MKRVSEKYCVHISTKLEGQIWADQKFYQAIRGSQIDLMNRFPKFIQIPIPAFSKLVFSTHSWKN